MVVGDAPIPPCTPCYQPLDAPELDIEVSGFALPPAMTPNECDDLGFYNFSWTEEPMRLNTWMEESNDIAEGKGKIGSLLFKAVLTLVNGQKVTEVGLPKEHPVKPRLQPSAPPFMLEEIPELNLPSAFDKDFDLFDDLDQVRPQLSFTADIDVTGFVSAQVMHGRTVLEMLSNNQTRQPMTSLSQLIDKSQDGRRRTSTCSTCVTLAEAPRVSPRPKLLETPNPGFGITGMA